MRKRKLLLELYADEDGMAWVRESVKSVARARHARVIRWSETPVPPDDDSCDYLAEQWAYEQPGQDPGARRPVELRLSFTCSLRVWRSLRKGVLLALCPEGDACRACRVPWAAC
ncbi:hypothetical protein QCN29_28735 [Streptomyces sp. HNM0663]|uniref:Uncharacterized protein n=1 Tax=Streptomyces chengmaiensis TaxID=3040919 RepID=A0ABT6HWD2_9ACTN|nr:hypothetical protein [Streptomyces chengmaiensis]MDH2392695.1 hypothetical protein [Streptomyces chengmaiensis]